MKYYKTTENGFHAFSESTPQEFIDNKISELGLIETTKDYIDEYNAQQAILNKESEKAELAELKQYLLDTDYMVIKSIEKGSSMLTEYPDDYIKRQEARNRINEINSILEL